MRKEDERCVDCGCCLEDDESAARHEGKSYCLECMKEHIESEHAHAFAPKSKDSRNASKNAMHRVTPESRRAWEYKQT